MESNVPACIVANVRAYQVFNTQMLKRRLAGKTAGSVSRANHHHVMVTVTVTPKLGNNLVALYYQNIISNSPL